MTEKRTDPVELRLDLRVLDAAADDGRAEAVIGAVMSRIAMEKRGVEDEITRLLRARRRMLALAGALAGLAAASVLALPRRAMTVVEPISAWSQTDHVPTNGELLALFQGYGQ